MQAVILAGGKGTRLQPITDLPKSLVPINGIPLLDQLIKRAAKHGITNVIVGTGYQAGKISKHLGKSDYGISVKESREDKPLGTAGPLRLMEDKLEDEFVVYYGDVFTTVNIQKLIRFHRENSADATLVLRTSDHPQDSTVVTIDKNNKIRALVEKPGESWRQYGNLTNAALYVFNKSVLKFIPERKNRDLARDIFPKMLDVGASLYGYVTNDFIKDIGTPERYDEVQTYVSQLRPAAFLDRDGCINEDAGLISKPEQIKLTENAAEGIKLLNKAGIPVIIVTNQPVVARNMVTEEELATIHDELVLQVQAGGGRIDALYYCPHHPETYHPEANDPKYRRECECRKPSTGMIDQATKKFKLDVENSYVVGDKTTDIKLGKNAGCTTILVQTGYAGEDGKEDVEPDYTCNNLYEACKLIVSKQ